jgi:hypothetical protein
MASIYGYQYFPRLLNCPEENIEYLSQHSTDKYTQILQKNSSITQFLGERAF